MEERMKVKVRERRTNAAHVHEAALTAGHRRRNQSLRRKRNITHIRRSIRRSIIRNTTVTAMMSVILTEAKRRTSERRSIRRSIMRNTTVTAMMSVILTEAKRRTSERRSIRRSIMRNTTVTAMMSVILTEAKRRTSEKTAITMTKTRAAPKKTEANRYC
jgi:hypothetical protein